MSSRLHAGHSAMTRVARGSVRWAEFAKSPATPWIALAVLVVGTGALLIHETRGTTLWFDEWTWLLHRRGGSLGSFLDSHDGHMSLIPVAIYKLLFATAGIRHSVPYRAVMIAEHLGISVLVFVYARRRVGPWVALVAATVMLLFGPGWENMLWAFQISWNTSLLAALAALLALDRRDRAGNIAACVLLACALASSGLGVPIALGVAVEVLLTGRRGAWWVVAVPVALYAIWAVGYQDTTIVRHAWVAIPSFVATGLASTLGGLSGLGGSTGVDTAGSLMTWGPELLVAALAAAGWRLARLRRLEPRVVALATIVLSFWVITALTRVVFANPYSSRYLYVSALFVVLLAVELARGARVNGGALGLIGLLAAGAILSNVGSLRTAARLFRADGLATTADLGALEIGRPVMPPGYVAEGLPGVPFVIVPAAAYFAAERDVGTPASTPAQIAADPEGARSRVDRELIRIHGLTLAPAQAGAPAGAAAPAVDSAAGATTVRGGCVTFIPSRYTPSEAAAPAVALTVPPSGLLLEATGGSASVAVRRFADTFQTLGTLAPSGPATLVIAPDGSPRAWHVQLSPSARAVACGLR